MKNANKQFENSEPPNIIARGDSAWRVGVLGLTANRLMEQYERPVCLWAHNHEGQVKGSIRSDGTVNVVDLFAEAGGDDFFLNYGGHELSGGFSLSSKLESELETRLIAAYNKLRTADSEFSKIYIDTVLGLEDVNDKTYALMEKLSPFGVGNPKPQFLFSRLEITDTRIFGNNGNRHLEIILKNDDGKEIKATVFFKDQTS